MSETDTLDNAVKAFLSEVTKCLTISHDTAILKDACDRLSKLSRDWNGYNKTVTKAISSLMHVMQSNCEHKGAQTGYNERDGSWMNPCPTCGYSR